MAHYAKLNAQNVVVSVFVGRDEQPGVDWEAYYQAKRTSYNTRAGVNLRGVLPFRKNYAGVGYTFDATRDAFIPPQPAGGNWTLDEATCNWVRAT